MKKMRQKMISLLLVGVFSLNMGQGIFATSLTSVSPTDDEISLKYDGHGQYSKISHANNEGGLSASAIDDVIVATATDDEDVYFLEDNKYVLHVASESNAEQKFLLVERTDIDVQNYREEDLKNYNIPDEIVKEISFAVAQQKEIGNDDFELSVFCTPSQKKNAAEDGWTENWDENYTLYGQQFTDTYIKYWNYSCAKTVEGNGASSAASAFKTILLECAGKLSQTVAAFQSGYSALKVIADFLGVSEVSAGNKYAKIQTTVTYDAVYKVTRQNATGNPTVATCKAWLNANATQQTHPDAPGGIYQTKTFLNKTILSPHFDNPAEWLYNDYYNASGVIEGPIYMTLLGERFKLV